ncbi:MAG: cellulase family glycosylhydrolase [Williamsia sp.]|nr:cellulase family glycosylhydrolase [Williamsia sp.]
MAGDISGIVAVQEPKRPIRLEPSPGMPWIEVAKDAPYFTTDQGEDWTPIGQNDAITWPELRGLFRRKDFSGARQYLHMLSQHGVTCLRLMLEYCHGEHRYLEKPAGSFQPNMIRLWDDIFALCEEYGLRILLTPYDTFWMWIRWKHHPYNKKQGGTCQARGQWLLCTDTRKAIKQRLAWATERWGGSGALFAWDIWNEIHPAHAGDSADCFAEFIEDVGSFLRQTELRLHGRAHPQTVSVFGPVLDKHPHVAEPAFRHPALDFASIHFYEKDTIDRPRNTVDAAVSTGRLTREALAHAPGNRPFFDSEHGPIHHFKDHHKTLPEPFDDEYFRHMQWAHFASGGAGGGMRWPNRHPHSLTAGMRRAQQSLARFVQLINWQQFRRRNLNKETEVSERALTPFCCGDEEQVVLWLLRTDTIGKGGMLYPAHEARQASAKISGLRPGRWQITVWDTSSGSEKDMYETVQACHGDLTISIPPVYTDLAFAIRYTGIPGKQLKEF